MKIRVLCKLNAYFLFYLVAGQFCQKGLTVRNKVQLHPGGYYGLLLCLRQQFDLRTQQLCFSSANSGLVNIQPQS